jgi:hypothetical protein
VRASCAISSRVARSSIARDALAANVAIVSATSCNLHEFSLPRSRAIGIR